MRVRGLPRRIHSHSRDAELLVPVRDVRAGEVHPPLSQHRLPRRRVGPVRAQHQAIRLALVGAAATAVAVAVVTVAGSILLLLEHTRARLVRADEAGVEEYRSRFGGGGCVQQERVQHFSTDAPNGLVRCAIRLLYDFHFGR